MKTAPKKTRQKGFALIVTLSLMILLTVIAVGLLTLSTISLRSTSQGAAQAVANSNAKLAMMLAIGDLQKHLGPDQRVTADAASFKANSQQPNVVGVWDSLGWIPQGNDNTAPVPDPSQKAGMFRTWLVSTTTPNAGFGLVDGPVAADSVWLSNPATTKIVNFNDTTMRAERIPLTVGTARGGLAWMVSDNSTKAQINIAPKTSNDVPMNVANRTSASSPTPSVLHSSLEVDDPTRLISMSTAALAIGRGDDELMKEVTARAPSLTSGSLGLLTNTVLGGLKTDLTPMMESTSNSLGSVLSINGISTTPYSNTTDGAPDWRLLRDHYKKYQRMVSGSVASGTPKLKVLSSDIIPLSSGIVPRPSRETTLPVIAKMQIMFSLVAHHSHAGGRVNAYNQYGVPQGNNNHAVPHLVYDPVVTLYNPYDVELELSRLRIRISDPPIGFQFQKHDVTAGTNPWLRSEFASGAYHGMGAFQIANEHNPTAKKEFIFYLTNKTPGGAPGAVISLLPGETKVFSAWVENNWTWGLETASGVRSFFDWAAGDNLGTIDKRTKNQKGVEMVPGVDWRAGLQTDHLSYGDASRPADSRYSWEYSAPGQVRAEMGQGWPSFKLTDSITVNCRPQRIATGIRPDFQVDLLAASTDNPNSDYLRTYEFRLADVPSEVIATSTGSGGRITRKLRIGDVLQTPADTTPGGKTPFAIFTMSAKTTKDTRDDSKAWLFNNPVTEGGSHDSSRIGNAAQSYDLRLQEVQDFTVFPGVEIDGGGGRNRGYFGAIANATDGVSIVPMYRIPITPAASLGDWIGGNLITSSSFPRVNYPLGNSFAHPLIPSSDISRAALMSGASKMLDHSYMLNAVMWDNYYFSSAAAYPTLSGFSPAKGKSAVLEEFFKSEQRMLNSRLIPYISGSGDAEKVAADYAAMAEIPFAKGFAKNAMVEGAFNVNSSSIDAWRAVLSSLRQSPVVRYKNQSDSANDRTPFVRNGLPIAGSADLPNPANDVNALGQVRWAGYRSLSDGQIQDLATRIVAEIRNRNDEDDAPSLCLGDFINRRPGGDNSLHALKGIIQTAIDKTDINRDFHNVDSKTINAGALAGNRKVGLANTAALEGFTADGAAPMLTQGDVLTALAPIITSRGDTFTIRSYGEARAANGTTVLARAWCEATVQRIPDYVDPTNPAEFDVKAGLGDLSNTGLSPANQIFGRRFVVTSFRWLNSTEI
ncbi:MAG: hypothetical protein EOP88_08155 [Verrucomicrobiaceae bacterium]|nr:MAG: hypothetical protein EOP88_08155 [Verrucomicrobiaceae bacterium]